MLISIDEQYTIVMSEQEQKEFYIFKQDIINAIKNILNTSK